MASTIHHFRFTHSSVDPSPSSKLNSPEALRPQFSSNWGGLLHLAAHTPTDRENLSDRSTHRPFSAVPGTRRRRSRGSTRLESKVLETFCSTPDFSSSQMSTNVYEKSEAQFVTISYQSKIFYHV